MKNRWVRYENGMQRNNEQEVMRNNSTKSSRPYSSLTVNLLFYFTSGYFELSIYTRVPLASMAAL
jgi:hypothetical protein